MEITEVRIRKHRSEDGKLKAFASVVFDGSFVVHDMKIIEGSKGLFVAMPSRKRADGSHEDIAHPVNREFRQKIQAALLDKFHEESEPDSGDAPPDSGGTPPDSGGTPPDSGDAPPDSGDAPPDSGGTPPDSGGTPLEDDSD